MVTSGIPYKTGNETSAILYVADTQTRTGLSSCIAIYVCVLSLFAPIDQVDQL